MKQVNETVPRRRRPIGVVQFGEGNFLRAFADEMLDAANEAGATNMDVAVVKPIAAGSLETMRAQQGMYTVLLRGMQGGRAVQTRRVVTCVRQMVDAYEDFDALLALARLESVRFVVSNTTEAGIAISEEDRADARPPASFPGKLTRFLYERFVCFGGSAASGLILLPVELIEQNGAKLRQCVLQLARQWGLPPAFAAWVQQACLFANTLVDRIVTGYPTDEAEALWQQWGYEDRLLVAAEPFGLWVMECEDPAALQKALPLDAAGMPVVFTKDLRPYRERKVRILNGAHTGAALACFLAGLNTVGDCMQDEVARSFIEALVRRELAPTVPLPPPEVEAFAAAVLERFQNPFIRHRLLSIALNSVAKWRTRNLPALLDLHAAHGAPPVLLTFSFAALLAFYAPAGRDENGPFGLRGNTPYPQQEDADVLTFFAAQAGLPPAQYVAACAANQSLWGRDLTELPGFCTLAARQLARIQEVGMKTAMKEALQA